MALREPPPLTQLRRPGRGCCSRSVFLASPQLSPLAAAKLNTPAPEMLSLLLQDDGAGPHNAAYFFGYMGAAFALIFASELPTSTARTRGEGLMLLWR